MKLRKPIRPRRKRDVVSVLAAAFFAPSIGVYALIVILPAFHVPGGLWHIFAVLLISILLFNIEGNLVMGMLIDTSVDFAELKPPPNALSLGWHQCTDCDKSAPPRSWHCKICRTCILKRDHHCAFFGNCIGHRNYRYFIMLILHLLIFSTYTFVYNCIYIWLLQKSLYRNWFTALKLLFPPLMVWKGSIWTNIRLFFYLLNVFAVIISSALFVYHFPLCLRGNVSYERGQGNIYDMGWRKNLREILGERIYLVALCPFIRSKLPNEEGIEWPTNSERIPV